MFDVKILVAMAEVQSSIHLWGAFRPRGLSAFCIALARHGIARGAMRRLCYKALRQLGTCYDIKVDGIRMRCHITGNSTEKGIILKGRRQDADDLSMIMEGLVPGDTFVDVGANCGLFTLMAARRVASIGHVLSIEPLPLLVDRLRFNVATNGFANVVIFETAVGSKDGVTNFYVDQSRLDASSISGNGGTSSPMVVPVRTLISILKESRITEIKALKIDVEGHEDQALIPFIEAAPRKLLPKRILMETNLACRWKMDVVELLLRHGYREIWKSKKDLIVEL